MPLMEKLSELLVSGYCSGLSDSATSPRSPLDIKMPSPRGLKHYDSCAGVGLAILASLDKTESNQLERRGVLCSQDLNRSNPIPVTKYCKDYDRFKGGVEQFDMENYTYVTCRVPGKSFAKLLYCDGDRHEHANIATKRDGFSNYIGSHQSPATERAGYDVSAFRNTSHHDFLSWCHLCRKSLHGKDIYMYRGEKGFCSAECRSRQIMMDENKQVCRSEVSKKRSTQVSTTSTCNTKQIIFSTGILAST